MVRIGKYFRFVVRDFCDLVGMEKLRLYRAIVGGHWCKHSMNGELPNCYGSFWAKYGKINRYTDIVKEEDYNSKK